MRRKPLFPPPRDAKGRCYQNKGRQPITIQTINGPIEVRRIRYYAPGEGACTPADALVDSSEATVSVGVCEMASRLGCHGSNFDQAAADLQRTAQVSLSGERLRQLVEREGRCVLQAEQQGVFDIGWKASDCQTFTPSQTKTSRVYLGSDGVQVPMVTSIEKKKRRHQIRAKRQRSGKRCRPLSVPQPGADQRYKEFKLVVYYDQDQSHRHVVGTKGNHRVAGRLMRRDAGRIGLDQAEEKVAIVDGADWIRHRIESQNLPMDQIVLDFYHLAEHVHKARRIVFGETSDEGQTWAGHLLHVVKHEGYAAFWQLLVERRAQERSSNKRAALDELMGYVSEREKMICYPECQERGWDLGSGPTEAMCKATTLRLKGCGMRWDGKNAESIMALLCLEQSGLWQAYWRTRLPAKT